MRKKSQQYLTPNGWREVRLAELFEFKNGLNKEKRFFGQGTPIVNYMDIYRGGYLIRDGLRGKVEVSDSEQARFSVKKGDVFFTRTSETLEEIGMVAVVVEEIPGAVFSGFVLRARPKDNLIDPKFASYSLCSSSARKEIIRKGSYTTRALTSGASLGKVKILLPPIDEQKRIVQILETWSDAIRTLSVSVKYKETRLEGIKNKLLSGDFRLPGFSSPWHHFEIGNFATTISRTNTKAIEYPVLSCTKYDGLVKSLEYFGRKIYGDDLSKYKVVNRGEFAYATNHIEEGSLGFQNVCDTALISPMYTVFKTNSEKVDDRFIYPLLKTPRMIHHYQSNMSGSIARRGGLRWSVFATLPVFMPMKKEQTAIADVIETAQKEINVDKRKRTLLEKQQTQLLNDLVTGKLDTLQGRRNKKI